MAMTSSSGPTELVNVSIFHPSTKNFSVTSPTTIVVSSNHSLDLTTGAAGSVNGTTEHVKGTSSLIPIEKYSHPSMSRTLGPRLYFFHAQLI